MRATQLVELVAAILATILNLILIPIIVTKSSIRMGAYKYFLLAYTITAAIYSYCVSTALFVGCSIIQMSANFRLGTCPKMDFCSSVLQKPFQDGLKGYK